jgi:hypothetical protein
MSIMLSFEIECNIVHITLSLLKITPQKQMMLQLISLLGPLICGINVPKQISHESLRLSSPR